MEQWILVVILTFNKIDEPVQVMGLYPTYTACHDKQVIKMGAWLQWRQQLVGRDIDMEIMALCRVRLETDTIDSLVRIGD